MEHTHTSPTLRAEWWRHAQMHPYSALGLGLASVSMVWLFLSGITQHTEDMLLGLAAGSMMSVVSHEVIPESHRNGYQIPATLGLMVGFAIMMLLDTSLG